MKFLIIHNVLNTLIKRKKLLIIILLFFLFFLSIAPRLYTLHEPYLLEADSFYFYRQAKVLLNGKIAEEDILRLHPTPPQYQPSFFTYLIVYTYKFFHFFLPDLNLLKFCFWFSAILGALTILPVYFIGRALFNTLVGLIAAFFFSFSSFFLLRTMAGRLDTDGLNLLFLSSIIALFVLALSKAETRGRPLVFAFLSGVLLAVWAWTWTGYWLGFWIILALLFFHFAIVTLSQFLTLKGRVIKEKIKETYATFKRYFILYSICFLSFFLVATPLLGFSFVRDTLFSPFQFFTGKAGLAKTTSEGFPSVLSTVAELQPVRNWVWVIAIEHLGLASFFLGLLGIFLLTYFFIRNFHQTHWQYLFPLVLIWFLSTLIPFLSSVRYGEFFALPLAILAGFSIITLWQKTFEFLKEKMRLAKLILILLVALTASSFYLTFTIASGYALNVHTYLDANWAAALSWIKEETSEEAVIVSWWDFGYWIEAIAERRTIIDNGTQGSTKETTLGEISPQECRGRGGYIKDQLCITLRIQDVSKVLFASDENKALDILKSYRGDASEIYLLLSADLIPKASHWSYFATWDREKKEGKIYRYKYTIDQKTQRIYIPEELEDSLFTKLFILEGESLLFELKYENPEIKIYKIKF